jgi:hypothetical protein
VRRNCIIDDDQYDSYYASRVAAKCEPFLREAGIDIVKCISCGVEGCVYKITEPGLIAKVTYSTEEATLSAWLMQQDDLPKAFPKIEGVWELPGKCKTGKRKTAGYLILREDLADLKVTNYRNMQTALHTFVGALSRLIRDEDLEIFERDTLGAMRTLTFQTPLGRDLKHYEQLLEITPFAVKHRIVPFDLHVQNLGLRKPDQLVIRDLGLSSYSQEIGKVALPEIS